ncbi:MAG: keto-deoxy-phosphogluconate aldolase, partial [Rhodospirillales bacterium]
FAVSPGAGPALLDAAAALPGLPLLPGCATPSEAMTLAERGYHMLKFFPAGAAGGPAMLKAMSGPLPDIRFCPTGGVSLENAADYLALPNVVTVGGSWVVPGDRIRAGDWDAIEAKAREAVIRLG